MTAVSPTAGRRRGPTRLGVVAVLLAAVSTVTGCGGLPAGAAHTMPSDGQFSLIQEPQATYAPIRTLIERAAKSVRMEMYLLADPGIEQALVDAHRHRGVATTVVLDRAFHGQGANQGAYDALRAAGVNVTWAPAGTIVHEKALVIDDKTAVVSTGNLDARYYATARDAAVVTTVPTQVAAIAATIDADYAQAAAAGQLSRAVDAVGLVWSPAARAVFVRAVSGARRSVDITSEEFKDRAVAAAVSQAARRGVACRIVLNADAAATAAVGDVEHAGCAVHTVPTTTGGLYLHEKALVTDGFSVLIGSHNLSTMSLTENRELSLHVDAGDAPNVVAAVRAQFDADFAAAPAATVAP
ncbi:phospholipase D-like domain-containing protein [Mycobacterium avium]|uniref:phospholipase D-like domain-containing protein n=1 Tax=Mycobacterium avium TaxID=1764 RepID=UPI000ABCA07E|nr:phospholipase D-like domain-containing protein [Mycobacterium avium]